MAEHALFRREYDDDDMNLHDLSRSFHGAIHSIGSWSYKAVLIDVRFYMFRIIIIIILLL